MKVIKIIMIYFIWKILNNNDLHTIKLLKIIIFYK